MFKQFFVVGVISGLFAGLTYILFPYGMHWYQRWQSFHYVSPVTIVSPSPQIAKIAPSEIRIPKLNKDLPIVPAHVDGNVWELYDDKVSWLATSEVPGKGNVILYAHNRTPLFGNLYLLKAGDEIEVLHEGIWKKYIVNESRSIQPTDVEAILSDKDQLTLYTCEGSFDQKRLVVYALPILK